MRRLSKSEIDQRKQRQPKEKTVPPPSPATTATVECPAVPFDQVVTSFRNAVVDYYVKVPHLRAFTELRAADPASSDLLSPVAAALFVEVRKAYPNDPISLHHLAIIHHGRGYQLHLNGDRSPGALRHWHDGLQAWAALVRNDSFWEILATKWRERWESTKSDMLAERLTKVDLQSFRHQIPRHLLTLHTTIALECFQTDPGFAKEHMAIVLQSGFDKAAIDVARQRVYTKLLGNVSQLCQQMKFVDAREVVNRYLCIDPDNIKALCNALEICVAECRQEGVSGQNVEKRLRQMTAEEKRVEQLILHANQDWSVADVLRDFYLQWASAEQDRGESYQDQDTTPRWQAYEKGMQQALVAIGYERFGDAARRLLLQICWNGSISAANVNTDIEIIRRLVDLALPIGESNAGVRAANAFYFLRREQEDKFRQELKRAEELNVAEGSQAVAGLIAHLKEESQGSPEARRANRLLKQADQAIGKESFSHALTLLSEVDQLESKLSGDKRCLLHMLTAVCHIRQGNMQRARASYRQAVSVRGVTNPEYLQLLRNLSKLG